MLLVAIAARRPRPKIAFGLHVALAIVAVAPPHRLNFSWRLSHRAGLRGRCAPRQAAASIRRLAPSLPNCPQIPPSRGAATSVRLCASPTRCERARKYAADGKLSRQNRVLRSRLPAIFNPFLQGEFPPPCSPPGVSRRCVTASQGCAATILPGGMNTIPNHSTEYQEHNAHVHSHDCMPQLSAGTGHSQSSGTLS